MGEHPEPVAEMKRIYYTTGRRLGYRSFSSITGPDVIELKRMLHAVGVLAADARGVSEAPPSTNTEKMRALQKSDRAQYDTIVAESRRLAADYTRDYATFDGETIAAVDKFREDNNLNYQGNPPGLVDDRFVAALRSAYFAKKKAASKN